MDPGQAHGSGDVKYHLGAEGKYIRPFGDGQVDVTLVANPSHLEVVDPVLEGVARAKQDMLNLGEEGFTVMPIALHGDAAFAGQGVVAETLQPVAAARVPHRRHPARDHQQPGRVHHRPGGVPVQRVLHRRRQDDPGADLPRERRRPGGRRLGGPAGRRVPADVRPGRRHRHGLLPPPRAQRGRRPVDDEPADVPDHRRQAVGPADLHRGADRPRRPLPGGRRRGPAGLPHPARAGLQRGPRPGEGGRRRRRRRSRPSSRSRRQVETKISAEMLQRIADVARGSSRRASPRTRGSRRCWSGGSRCPATAASTGRSANWSRSARSRWTAGWSGLSGQDTRRGTFVQRHSVLIDHKTGAEYLPLQHLSDDQERVLIYDSALTEYAALGFEYGYSVANRDALVMWEAQFGDFVNGAQSVIDEYLSSGEAKWGQQSGVVLLLPHAPRGPGPGPHLRPDRAVPAAVRRGLDDRRGAVDPGELLPPAAPARAGRRAPADGGVHPEVDAAQQGRGVLGGRLHRRASSSR